jgi:hypothetical protein
MSNTMRCVGCDGPIEQRDRWLQDGGVFHKACLGNTHARTDADDLSDGRRTTIRAVVRALDVLDTSAVLALVAYGLRLVRARDGRSLRQPCVGPGCTELTFSVTGYCPGCWANVGQFQEVP